MRDGIPVTLEPNQQPVVSVSACEAHESEKDLRRLAAGASISLVSKVVSRGFHIVGQIVLARWLGPATFGLYAIGWTLLRIVGAFAPLGLDAGVIRFASHSRRSDSGVLEGVLPQSLGLALGSGFLMGGGLYIAAPWLASDIFQKPGLSLVLRLFAVAFPFLAGLRVAAAATRVTQRMKFSAYAEELMQPVANLVLLVVFYLLGWRLLGAVAAASISFALAFVLALYYVKRLFPETFSIRWRSGVPVRELMSFSLTSSLAGTFVMLTIWVDRLMLGYFLPSAEVGIYQAASQSSIFFALLLSGFGTIFSPMIVDLCHQGEQARLGELFRVSTKWTLYLCLPAFLVVCFAPRPLMTIVFGSDYVAGWLPLVILSIGQMVNAGTGSVGLLLIMTGHQNRWFWISGFMLLANVILNLLWIPRWGMLGAALSTCCAISGVFLLSLWQVKKILHLWPYDRRYLKGLIAAAVTAAGLGLVNLLAHDWPFILLTSTVLASVIIFVAILSFLGLDSEDRDLFRSYLKNPGDSHTVI